MPHRARGGRLIGLLGPAVMAVSVAGCAYEVIPPHLQGQVNRSLTFEQLAASPTRYVGEWIVLGGRVLKLHPEDGATRLDIRHLPLTRSLVPRPRADLSAGRFQAVGSAAVLRRLPKGLLVTIVGRVEAGGHEPSIRIEDMIAWQEIELNETRPFGVGDSP